MRMPLRFSRAEEDAAVAAPQVGSALRRLFERVTLLFLRPSEFFGFTEQGTSYRTESVAGLTTFLTMSYVIIVNPHILSDAMGIGYFEDVAFATCIASAVGCLVMGLAANYPIALAPGMGINAFFAYAVVQGLGAPWELAMAAVFLSGLLFFLLSVLRVRRVVISAVPFSIRHATAAGIGIMIAFSGLVNAELVIPHQETLVTLGDVLTVPALLTILGTFTIGFFMARGFRSSILLGILGAAVAGMALGASPWPEADRLIQVPRWPTQTFGAIFRDGGAALREVFALGIWGIVLSFLFVDLFDTVGTLLGIAQKGGFVDERGEVPRANRALGADSVATMVGAVFGTSNTTSYIESTAGLAAGGRTGFANLITALLFIAALFVIPLVEAIPYFATAPALIVVGVLMASQLTRIDWEDITEALPGFIVMIGIPLTFSITNGLALGFLAHVWLKTFSGRLHEVHWLAYLLSAALVAKYLLLP